MFILTNKKESTTLCLLKFVCELFFKDGSGDPLFTTVYLKKHHNITDIPIINYHGNRFNTLFYNARGTFYLAKFLILYLESSKISLNYTQNYNFDALRNDKKKFFMKSFRNYLLHHHRTLLENSC
jgi:hypothetical protein